MRSKVLMAAVMISFILVGSGILQAANENASFGTQAGKVARELKDRADENYATGAEKVKETERKMSAQAQDALKTLQQQWDEFSRKFQVSAQQLSQQIQRQWEDFNKSFNQPKQ